GHLLPSRRRRVFDTTGRRVNPPFHGPLTTNCRSVPSPLSVRSPISLIPARLPTMSRFKRIVILTGAGISAESGIATFRDKGGIWSKVNVEDVATPEAFARNPQRVLDFYNMRRNLGAGAKPNAAHFALARLEAEHTACDGGQVVVVTQNV